MGDNPANYSLACLANRCSGNSVLRLRIANPNISPGDLQIFYHEATDELVFMTKLQDGTLRFARVPMNMGPPPESFPQVGSEQILSLTTTPNDLKILMDLRPIYGMNYEPAPSDYTGLPPPAQYGDTDFNNSDFEGLWGTTLVVGTGTCPTTSARDDVGNMKSDLGVNYLRSFNLDQEAFRDHVTFGNYCNTKGMHISWPLDFWVTSVTAPNWLSTLRALAITLIKTLGALPNTVVWRLGNELSGQTEAQNIATVFKLIVDNDPSKHPVTSSHQLGFFPSMATLIKTEILKLDTGSSKIYETAYNNLWFQSVNIYPPQANPVSQATVNLDLIINNTWPNSDFSKQPLLVTEYGTAENVASEAIQSDSIKAQAQFIKDQATNPSKPLFLGGCLFEYTNELWKGATQDDLGINKFAGPFCTAKEPSHFPPNDIYRVDTLDKKIAYATYKAIVNP